MVVNILSATRTGFAMKKCCDVLGTCMEFAMKEAGENFTPRISKDLEWKISQRS